MTTKTTKQAPPSPPAPVAAAPAAAPPQPVKTEPKRVSMIDKVKLIGDLSNACQNEEVVGLIRGLPNGERIYELFVTAIEKELQRVMTGQEVQEAAAVNLVGAIQQAQSIMDQFRQTIVGYMQTPLMQALSGLHERLGGAPVLAPGGPAPNGNGSAGTGYQPTQTGNRPVGLGSL